MDHNFYSYYKKMDSFSKKSFDLTILAFADSMLLTKRERMIDSDVEMWEKDFQMFLSSRLEKYFSL